MTREDRESDLAFLSGGGEMGARIRAMDWSKTSLGPAAAWSQSLRTATRILLTTRHPMCIFYGADGVMLYNDAFSRSMGPERHPSSLGQPAREAGAEVWEVIGPQIEQVMSGRGGTWHENQLVPMTRHGSREEIYWTYSYSPIDDEGAPNGVGGVLVVSTETTEQVLAAARLARSEERLQLALAGGRGVGTWDWDVPSDVLVADHRFAVLHGVDPLEAAKGAPVGEFLAHIHPDDLPTVEANIIAALAGDDEFVAEYRLVQPDGAIRWVAAEGRCILDADGMPLRFSGVSFDITARRNAEAELRRLNADLENQVIERSSERGTTWDVSPLLLSVIDLDDGRFIRVNPAWTVTLGWTQEDLTGAPYADFLHPDDLAASAAAFERVREGKPVVNFENRYRDKAGGYHWLSWVAVPENGKLYSTSRDVTAEKAAQAELALAQEQLRQSQKMEAVGQLTGGLAHDFNNLMTIIRSSADFLRRRDLTEERRRRYVDAISDTVDRAAKLTGQLLAFARRQPLVPEVFEARRRVESVAELIRPLTGARVEIRLDLCDEPCFVNADVAQFETALINLAVNGRDAMEGEGVLTFGVKFADTLPAIRAHPARKGAFVAISVADTGCGIPADKLAMIFEPFYTTKEVGKGTGLGLSQSFGFAKQSGGEIFVESSPGRGARFTLYLPQAPAIEAERAVAAPAAEGALRSRGQCILVVEDNKDVGQFSTEMLHDLGYTTRWASSAREALALLAQDEFAFDLVFSDVIMPGMNGVELAETIREAYPGLPVVLTSGYSHVLAENGEHGFELIRKPYSVEALSRVLRRTVAERSSVRR